MNGRNKWSFEFDEAGDGRFVEQTTGFGKPRIFESREEVRKAINDDLDDYFAILDAGNAEDTDPDS